MFRAFRFVLTVGSMFAIVHAADAAETIKVAASFSILGDMVQRVGGDRVDVSTIVGPGGDAHVYEPKPDDARIVAMAHVVVVNGLGFEGWIARLVDASGFRGRVTVASDGIAVAEADGAPDPHGWQSVTNAVVYVKNIADALCNADAVGCDDYRRNATVYTNELVSLDSEIKLMIARVPAERRVVITSHDAFGYFARGYGVTFLAPEGISTESEASASGVAALIRQIRDDKASALFVESVSDPRLAEQIGRETGLRVSGALYSDTLSMPDGPAATYISMMRHNATMLTDAMLGT